MNIPTQKGLSEKEFTRQRALWPFLKRLFRCSMHYKTWFWTLVASATLVAVIDALFPMIWLRYIDEFITPVAGSFRKEGEPVPFDEAVLRTFFLFGSIYFGFVTVQALGTGVFHFCAGRIKEYVIFDLRKAMFAKLQQLPYAFYDQSAMGWLLIRLTSDVDKVSEIISAGFVTLISGVMMIVACLIAMFFYSWKLALVVVLVIPLLVVFSARIRMLNLSYARKARRLYSMMAAFLTEHINGMEVNKATVQEGRAAADFRELTGQLKQASFKAAFYTAIYNPVVIIVGSVAAAGVVYLGGHLLFQPAYGISVGVLAAFFAYARSVFEPILDLTRYYAATQDSLSAGERIFSLIDEPVSIRDQAGALPFGKIRGHIRFENVDFHYHPDKPIIRNLNLDIRAGESVALVGPTGEGKSTLVSLICRFYEPTAGVIRIDGHDYKTKVLESYRSRLGIILQTPYLFSGTIADNVRYGKLGASRDEMREALELIGADDLAGRLDDQAGEEGNLLSAGEKQLISFARVILKDPDILLMDEATSSIDTLAELKIQRGIEKLIRGRTSVIIAHRLSTIRHCDRILVIRRGAVAEDGNHQQLMRKQGDYYELYSRQVREKGYAKEKLNQAQQG